MLDALRNDNEPAPLSLATSALLDIAEMQRSDPVDAASLVFLAERTRNMLDIAPSFRVSVRNAQNAADCGLPIAQPGEADLLAVTSAAVALLDAHRAFLDALLDINDFLHGEGLPGIPI